jgi:tetratricopeptide (TPR) repeat protein
MLHRFFLALAAATTALLLTITAARAHEDDAGKGTLGKVTFPTSCSPKVQAEFESGVAKLHSYWFSYAAKTFESVLQQDPNCAMAYWGIALDYLGNSLSAPPPAKSAHAAWAALEKARALGNSGAKTQRERDWIEAISTYYRDHDKVPVNVRLAAYTKAMEQITLRYPGDYEAKVFYALTLQASASKSDVTYAAQIKSANILEKLFKQNPQHPGVSHFLIHAYDYPPLAEKGIAAARRYAGIAPAVPHARHMPSHIYSMGGLWEDSIQSNLSALEIQPDYIHAYDFSVYAALQMAQDERAKMLTEKAFSTPRRGDRPIGLGDYTARAAIPARLVIERGDWAAAAALPVAKSDYPQADSLTHFTRGIGMARTGNIAGAKAEVEAMEALRAALQKRDDSYWASRTEEQMLAVTAWAAFAEGNKAQAEKLMRSAADSEDNSVKHVTMENRLYPLRELLAELLLEMGQAAPALREYEASLKAYPNRYRSIYGIARAAEAAGDRRKAAASYSRLMTLAKNTDSQRPELARARDYVAQR